MRRIAHWTVIATMVPLLALAASFTVAGAETRTSHLRLIYLSSDSPTVDFYVDGQKALNNIGYRTITNYMEISPSTHHYEVRKAGSPANSAPVADVKKDLGPDEYYSMIAAGKIDGMKATVLDDASPPNPPPAFCDARFLHAALGVPKVDVVVNGTNVREANVSFMEASNYQRMAAGTYDIELRESGTNQVIFTAKNFSAEGGHIYTLAAAAGVGRPVELVEMYDSSSAEVTPQSGVKTGGGGLAVQQDASASHAQSERLAWREARSAPAGALLLLTLLGSAWVATRYRTQRTE